MRKRSTPEEKALWEELRNRKLRYKFFRQYSVSGFVMDFYCPEKRFGIELEGEIHSKSEIRVADKFRFRYLEAFGITIVRIINEVVRDQLTEVVRDIGNRLDNSPSCPLP